MHIKVIKVSLVYQSYPVLFVHVYNLQQLTFIIKHIPRRPGNNQDKRSSPITTVNGLASQRSPVLPNGLVNERK